MAPDPQQSKIPSVAELQKFVRDKTKLEFYLLDGNHVIGRLKWFDEEAFSLIEDSAEGNTLTLLRQHILAYKPAK